MAASESKALRSDESGTIAVLPSGSHTGTRAGRHVHLWRLREVEVCRWVCGGGGFMFHATTGKEIINSEALKS